MARSKYPPFERKCANHLVEGVTRIVVRSQQADCLRLHGADFRGPRVPPGIYLVTKVSPGWSTVGRKRSRYYQVALADVASDAEFITAFHGTPTRYNVITEG